MALMNQVSGRMVNIEEDGVEAASGLPGIETVSFCKREKVSLHEATPGISCYFFPQWHEFLPVPPDHGR